MNLLEYICPSLIYTTFKGSLVKSEFTFKDQIPIAEC